MGFLPWNPRRIRVHAVHIAQLHRNLVHDDATMMMEHGNMQTKRRSMTCIHHCTHTPRCLKHIPTRQNLWYTHQCSSEVAADAHDQCVHIQAHETGRGT